MGVQPKQSGPPGIALDRSDLRRALFAGTKSRRIQCDGGRQLAEVIRGQRAVISALDCHVCVLLLLCLGAVSVLSPWSFHDV